MARQCPNCGEEILVDKAQFCYNCGVNLPVALEDDEGTMQMPPFEPDGDEETKNLRHAGAIIDNEETKDLHKHETRAEERSPRTSSDTINLRHDEPDAVVGAEGRSPRTSSDTINLRHGDEEMTKSLGKLDTVAGTEGRSPRTSSETINLRHGDEETKLLHGDEQTDDDVTMLSPVTTTQIDEETKGSPGTESMDDGATIAGAGLEPGDTDEETQAMVEVEPASEAGTKRSKFDLMVDRDLQGRYRLNQVLGRGGFGAVYLADDMRLNRSCVVKRMLTKGKSGRALRIHQASFEQEAKLLAALNEPGHPNIPEIYDYFSDESGNYLVMKHVEGRNLKEVLAQNEEALPWREAVRYVLDVCSALEYMHTQGSEPVMHRDIKPANILLGDDGRVWLVDFGLAMADANEAGVMQSSGSVGYTPLEQWLGEAVSASDIYALGATLHHLVTGINPREAYGEEYNIVKIQEMHGQFSPIRKINRKLPKDLEEIISQAVSMEPDERPSAHEFQQQLEVMFSAAQKAALYTFRDGKSAKTVPELVDLCEQNRREAEEHLYSGGFERWFLLIGRNDLAAAATQAVKEGKNQRDGLEKFLKLILPNIFFRRLRKATWEFTRVGIQAVLIFMAVVILVAIAASFVARLFIQQSLANNLDWQFNTLDPQGPNHYTDEFFTNKFNEMAGAYFDNSIKAEVQSPNQLKVTANWLSIPLEVPVTLRLEDEKLHFYVTEVNNLSLFLIANNITQGINNGVDEAFQADGINVSELTVQDNDFMMRVEGMVLPTATPSPTPLPTPTATPTPSNTALVIIFNELDEGVTLKVENETSTEDITWEIAANDSQVIEIPPGEYEYRVTYNDGAIAAVGTKEWTLDTAYRLRIGFEETE